jgi:hypothetical protein
VKRRITFAFILIAAIILAAVFVFVCIKDDVSVFGLLVQDPLYFVIYACFGLGLAMAAYRLSFRYRVSKIVQQNEIGCCLLRRSGFALSIAVVLTSILLFGFALMTERINIAFALLVLATMFGASDRFIYYSGETYYYTDDSLFQNVLIDSIACVAYKKAFLVTLITPRAKHREISFMNNVKEMDYFDKFKP